MKKFSYETNGAQSCLSKRTREILFGNGREPSLWLEAHDSLSAKLVEEAGFDCIWASGFSISTSLGYRDMSEMTASELTSVVAKMTRIVDTPVIVDGDTGYGDFNNVKLLVESCIRSMSKGLVLEDKKFPKANSFLGSEHILEDTDIFCGKIAAAKTVSKGSDFAIIARTETYISGGETQEAVDKCEAYVEAGADAVFVHSKWDSEAQIMAFCESWNLSTPIVIAPTTYPNLDVRNVCANGVNSIIYANQMMRAAAHAMQAVACTIRKTRQSTEVEDRLASVRRIFELYEYDDYKSDEEKYAR